MRSVLVAVLCLACLGAVPLTPAPMARVEVSRETLGPDSLRVRATWTASTVASPTGPITYQVTWSKGASTVVRIDTTAALEAVLRYRRSGIGIADTVEACVRPLYRGTLHPGSCGRGVWPNPDTQVPTPPAVIVDTLALTLDSVATHWDGVRRTTVVLAPGQRVLLCPVFWWGDGRASVKTLDLPRCDAAWQTVAPARRGTAAQEVAANALPVQVVATGGTVTPAGG